MSTQHSAGAGRGVRGYLGGALVAFELLTPLRLRRTQRHGDRAFVEALGWYPLIGLVIGAWLLLLDRALTEILPPEPVAALLVAFLALASGGLHLDGVADTADGMAMQGDRAERLGVMSEGYTGPAGVMALVIVLIAQWSAIVALPEPVRSSALLLAPCLARWTVAPVGLLFQPARPRGVGFTIHGALWPVAVPLSTLIAVAAAVVLFGLPGLVLVALAAAGGLLIAAAAARLLHGITGDVYGAAIEVSQVVVWISLVAAAHREWISPLILD